MTTFQLSKTKQKELLKRLRRLEKNYSEHEEDFTDDRFNEIKQIELILKQINAVDTADNITGKNIKYSTSLSNSRNEEWYHAMFAQWLLTHESTQKHTPNKASSIYKFTLHFFVDNVVLNPLNAGLNYEELTAKFRNMMQPDRTQQKIAYSLEDIKALTALVASIQLAVVGQPIDSPTRQIAFTELPELGTDVDPNSKLGLTLEAFQKNRQRDKLNRQSNDDFKLGGLDETDSEL